MTISVDVLMLLCALVVAGYSTELVTKSPLSRHEVEYDEEKQHGLSCEQLNRSYLIRLSCLIRATFMVHFCC